jgi:hypothetical protein
MGIRADVRLSRWDWVLEGGMAEVEAIRAEGGLVQGFTRKRVYLDGISITVRPCLK